jgi:hypothetical protein
MRRSKLIYLGLPFLLLIAYLLWLPGPSINKVHVKDDLGYVADGYNFRIFQLTPEGVKTPLSYVGFNSTVKSFSIETTLAFVITRNGVVHVVNIHNPFNAHEISSFSTQGNPQSTALRGNTAFIADGPNGISIVNLQDPRQPRLVRSLPDLGSVSDIEEERGLLYVARSEHGLDILDTTNPIEPTVQANYDAGGSINQVTVQTITNADNTLSILGTLLVGKRAVQVVDFTNPQQPALLNSFDFGEEAEIDKVIIQGNRIFTSRSRDGVTISVVRDGDQLDPLLGTIDPRNTRDFAVLGETVFIAAGRDGLQSYNFLNLENIYPVGTRYSNLLTFKFWVFVLGVALVLLWLAFFAQFVLPVKTFSQRQKIFDRLITYLFGGHGPALFIENGIVKEHSEERLKKGPGVVWLDSASAAVTRTAVKIKQTLGPGVHFIDRGEFIAETDTIDLHTQFQSVGPKETDEPFAEQAEDQDDEKYKQIQDRRKAVRALTRDGIEVIPNISVDFRVDTGYPKENEPGSRFGFRSGIIKEGIEPEKADKRAVYKAIIGQAVNLNELPDSPRRRLAWNELPASLAVDVWREYVGKFTLNELFTPSQEVPSKLEKPPFPSDNEIEALSQPVQVLASQNIFRAGLVSMLRGLNQILFSAINLFDEVRVKTPKRSSDTPELPKSNGNLNKEPDKIPALQVINEMVKARLTQPEVDFLNDNGKRGEGTVASEEYKILQARGLKVHSASIRNVRLDPKIDEQLIGQWSSTWYANAKTESDQIDRKRDIIETSAREQALIKYSEVISREINELADKGKANAKNILKALLLRSRALIRSGEHSEQLRRRMSVELQEIEDIIEWMEENGK